MISVVRPCISRSSASFTRCSLSASSALVASSSTRIARVLEHGAGDGDALLLAAGELHAALAHQRR